MNSPGLDVVVVNYQTATDLRRFLDSFAQFPPTVPHSLTIANVCPRTEDLLVGQERVGARHWISDENCGYARACNHAATFGDHDVIAFFNADTLFTSEILDECHDQLMAHDDWAILGPRQITSEGQVTHGGIVGTNVSCRPRWWKQANGPYANVVEEVVSVSGAAYFVKRAVWDEMTDNPAYRAVIPDTEGAFLPTQHYYEETFCSYHARHLGWKVVYYGPATMIHEWHRASPVGTIERTILPQSRVLFQTTCDAMGIEHD